MAKTYFRKSKDWKDPFGANKRKRQPGKDIDKAFGNRKGSKRVQAFSKTNTGIGNAAVSVKSRF